MTSTSSLRPLRAQFRDLAYQALAARLADVAPAHGPDWRPEDTVWFSNRVSDKQFVSVVAGVEEVEGEPVVALSLVDTSHPTQDTFIAQEIIQVPHYIPTTSTIAIYHLIYHSQYQLLPSFLLS